MVNHGVVTSCGCVLKTIGLVGSSSVLSRVGGAQYTETGGPGVSRAALHVEEVRQLGQGLVTVLPPLMVDWSVKGRPLRLQAMSVTHRLVLVRKYWTDP